MLLEIDNLDLSIAGKPILKQVCLTLGEGEILGVVGESGSGKSLTALSVMQLLPNFSKISGSVRFAGVELTNCTELQMCRLRGDDIGMVFQEPMTALNPLQTIGDQIAEGIRLHSDLSEFEVRRRRDEIMEKVGLPPSRISPNRYPHELSGGQRQRIGIAIACVMKPKLLIADEPTTALDVTIQAQILKLLRDLVRDEGMALMLISHDLGVVADMADRIVIMRDGEIVEAGGAVDVLTHQRHAYTRKLALASTHVPERTSIPVMSVTAREAGLLPLLQVRDLVCEYPMPRTRLLEPPSPFRAVNGVTMDIWTSKAMGLVGESGCGKSTLARAILGLHKPESGKLEFDQYNIASGDPEALRGARQEMQIVFQDPFGSFNPRHKVARLVGEPLYLRPEMKRADKDARVVEALESVGLSADDRNRYPHEFSGGQRQRLAIARALVIQPRMIIADEPVSALDVSIRAQIIDLLAELRDRLGIACLFISHDLSVVRALCDEVMVMRNGKICERGPVSEVLENPKTDYTRELVEAAPDLHKSLENARKSAAAHLLPPPPGKTPS